jgi:hypothetical protein
MLLCNANFEVLLKYNSEKNRVLRRMFGPKRKEVVGDWRRLHNEELHSLYTALH